MILSFWAEWCGPCRNEMPQLRVLDEGSDLNGLTVIGIHPPGSPLEDIRKVMEEFQLGYPTCIDIAPRADVKAWGDLFGQFAVRSLPHAVAVDRQGTILACGRLQDVIVAAFKAAKNSD